MSTLPCKAAARDNTCSLQPRGCDQGLRTGHEVKLNRCLRTARQEQPEGSTPKSSRVQSPYKVPADASVVTCG